MPLPETLPFLPAATAALLAIGFLVLYLVEKRRAGALAAQLRESQALAASFKTAPQTFEYRVERFELIWYPLLTVSPAERAITAAAAGLPHCRNCAVAFKSEGKDWACPKCNDRRPETVADTMVVDSVIKEAVKFFLDRHPDYRSALGR